ncbi:unnamed protein product [Paramecium pentaurelia]|uniref:TOG domain-containing protein n=1 Tax=Paramecium pentaurelia TaxID=43138 RepID=A0A8S1WKL9_9CILI|nr:unnamed protein product [Paramecium pentaurelia]
MQVLINSIYESAGDTRIELINLMQDDIKAKKGIVLGDLSRIFIMINQMLIDTNKQVILATHGLLSSLIDYLLPAELEGGLKHFENQLIHNLADSDRQIRKSTKSIFLKFIAKTRNSEQVLELLSDSFKNKNFYIRERSINLIPDIFIADKSIFCNRTGINEVRKVIESIIIHLNDVNESVRKASKKVIQNLKNIENFELVYRRLAVQHQNVVDKIQQEMPPKVDKFIELNFKIQEHKDPLFDQFVPFEFIAKTNLTIDDFPQDLKTQLYFGFLPKEILQDTLNQKDLAIREKGITELNMQFFEDEGESQNYEQKTVDKIVKGSFMPSFFKYISSLFFSEDKKIILMILNIIGKIMQVPGVQVNVYLPLCLPGLVQCLKDERVIIRQKALFLLRKLTNYISKKQYFQNLIYFLEQKMDNWHQKEELINLVSYLILMIHPSEQWFYGIDWKEMNIKQEKQIEELSFNLREVDFKNSLITIASYLNDSIAKVKYASLECLSLLAYLDKKHLEYLHEILNNKVYEKLNDKVDNGIVYFINDNGNLELPQFNIKKLEEQKIQSQIKLSMVQSIQSEPKPQTPVESEKSEESRYKITYYYDKFQMSLNDKIIKSNASIDSLFASEHKNNQGTKYDMIIPLGQFQQTKANEQFKLVNSNLYIEKEKVDDNPYEDEIMHSDEDELQSIEFEYPTRTLKYRGHAPDQITKSKYQPIDDIKSRVFHTIKQLNEDINVDLQIPKVIKANVGAYSGYKYEDEEEADDEEIFIDTKLIKQQHRQTQPTQEESIINDEKVMKENYADNQIEQVQEIIKNQQLIYTPEQRYQKRLDEFLLSFEQRDSKNKGKNARKLKKKLKEIAKQEELPKVFDMPVFIDNARAETAALLINLSSLNLDLLAVSLHKFRVLLQNHLSDVYASQVPLLQIVNDVCRILSTQSDNPLYAIDYSQYKKNIPPQIVVRKIVFIALQTLSVAVQTLRSTLIQVQKMFTVCGVWLQDDNKQISQQAEQTMLDILRFCDDSQLQNILPNLYNKQSFNSKIYVGVLIEHLVIKYQREIFKSVHFNNIIQLISQMVIDQSFDVRRIGKKVFFKILTLGKYQIEEIVMQMHQQEKNQMKELMQRYDELVTDHQIGIFDQEEYMGLQVMPQKFNFEYEMIDDQIFMK